MSVERKITIFCVLIVSIIFTPLLPQMGVLFLPIIILFLGSPILALLFSTMIDSFLLFDGASVFIYSTLYTAILIPAYFYLKSIINI